MTHQGVKIEDFAPIGAAIENHGNRRVELSGLGERQYFGELIERAESARKCDERAGVST